MVRIEQRWLRRVLVCCAALLVVLLLGYAFRYPLLRALGNHLVKADPPAHADVAYVLGGAARDRGTEAARVYASGLADRFVFTGGNPHGDLGVLGIDMTEADMGRYVAVTEGLPQERTTLLEVGTSTMEEALALLQLALADGVDTVMVISSEFHLRRVDHVFRKRFAQAGITVLLHGAPDHRYDRERWWEREEGLLMVNNEYVKLLYYRLKYRGEGTR